MTLSTPDDPGILAEAIELVASTLELDAAAVSTHDSTRTLPQWDSLRTLLLASQLEIRHGVTLQSREIERLVSVRAVAETLARHARR